MIPLSDLIAQRDQLNKQIVEQAPQELHAAILPVFEKWPELASVYITGTYEYNDEGGYSFNVSTHSPILTLHDGTSLEFERSWGPSFPATLTNEETGEEIDDPQLIAFGTTIVAAFDSIEELYQTVWHSFDTLTVTREGVTA